MASTLPLPWLCCPRVVFHPTTSGVTRETFPNPLGLLVRVTKERGMKEEKRRKETAASVESSSPSLSLEGKGNLLPQNKKGKGVSVWSHSRWGPWKSMKGVMEIRATAVGMKISFCFLGVRGCETTEPYL